MRTTLRSFPIVALAVLMPGLTHAVPISGSGDWETTLQARDFNGDNIADGYYDTTLNITWLGNARAANGSAYVDGNNRLTFANATTWAASLTTAGGGWRLPKLLSPGSLWISGSSELAHLYTVTLGNTSQMQGNPPVNGTGFANTGNFLNVSGDPFWLAASPYPGDTRTVFWGSPSTGYDQLVSSPSLAWAVHDGDVGRAIVGVAVPVPEPTTWALLAGGLGLTALRRRAPRRSDGA